jgi:formylglycine-generating enzyme required for sulfatase activity
MKNSFKFVGEWMKFECKNTIFFCFILPLFLFCCNKPPPELFTDTGIMVYIPAGEFIMGTDSQDEKQYPPSFGLEESAYKNESPRREVYVDGFYIDKYEVTLASYKEFLDATGRVPPGKDFEKTDFSKWGDYPVININWFDAVACSMRLLMPNGPASASPQKQNGRRQ